MGERMPITSHGGSRNGHECRYYMAAGFLAPGDVVLDVACGVGYGADILTRVPGVKYVGVDHNLSELAVARSASKTFVQADLQKWQPDFGFDVCACFETIEHLPDYKQLIRTAQRARKWILASVPVVPTTKMNPWHKHDFKPNELPKLFASDEWQLFQRLGQPTELAEIYVFRRVVR